MAELHVGLDYRPVVVAPDSVEGRQCRALLSALSILPGVRLTLYSDGPRRGFQDRVIRQPAWGVDLARVRRGWRRLWYEHHWLPRALAADGVGLFVGGAGFGLPGPGPGGLVRVAWLHRPLPAGGGWREGLYRRHAYLRMRRWADEIVVPSHFVAELCGRHYPAVRDRLYVLPHLVRLGRRAPRQPLETPERYWLVVASEVARPHLEAFVQAWIAAGAVPDLVLVDGAVSAPLREAGGRRLVLLQAVSEAQLADLYRRAERLWQPPGGWGTAVVEALAAGTPVAVAAGVGLEEWVPPQTPVFAAEDGEGLARLMGRLAAQGRGEAEAPSRLQAWAARFDELAYLERVGAWLDRFR